MTETFCTSGSVKLKAGANVSSALTAEQYTALINQAENFINVQAAIPNYNLIDNYASLNDDVKKILEDAASSHAAIGAINYDMSGYTSRGEAISMVNINFTRFQQAMQLIKEKRHTDFMRNA